MIFKDNNSNIHFIINYFNSWYKDGKDEYFISLFVLISLQTNVLLRQSLLSIWAASVLFLTELSLHAVLCRDGQRRFEHSENEMMGLYDPFIIHHRGNNSIDLFCYKIYMFPHENISEQDGVFQPMDIVIKDRRTLST